ncbi:hypothetical protein ACJJVG_08760 [Pseudocitrobacter faecalis]|uniref:hypothetical protein n=1 Tax=Pseudocitrobacter faecalis TaxID=1398493 RepID=UPI00389A2559
MRQFKSLTALADYVSDEFSEEALNSVLLLVTRLESISLNDIKSIKVQVENADGAKLDIERDFTGTLFKVRPI